MQRSLIAAALALGGVAFAPLAAAHVIVSPSAAPAGAYQTLAFKVGHGCAGSATTAITVQIPDGVASAKPMPKPGWTIVLADAPARTVTWRGGPLPDAYYDEFVLQIKAPETPGRLTFKVGQACETGRNDWAEAPGAGKFPAPVLEVTPVAPAAGEHAGHHH